jgi:hypothetical protein
MNVRLQVKGGTFLVDSEAVDRDVHIAPQTGLDRTITDLTTKNDLTALEKAELELALVERALYAGKPVLARKFIHGENSDPELVKLRYDEYHLSIEVEK